MKCLSHRYKFKEKNTWLSLTSRWLKARTVLFVLFILVLFNAKTLTAQPSLLPELTVFMATTPTQTSEQSTRFKHLQLDKLTILPGGWSFKCPNHSITAWFSHFLSHVPAFNGTSFYQVPGNCPRLPGVWIE
jgi:hypothetical protein